MLWYKNWLETRARVIFLLLWATMSLLFIIVSMRVMAAPHPLPGSAIPPPPPVVVRLASSLPAFPFVFIFMFLAGTGISTPFVVGSRNQSAGKSTLYTVSLPVSRRRLLLVRASLGFIESTFVSGLLLLVVWATILRPNIGMVAMAGRVLTLLAFGVGIYFLSTLFAIFLEDPYHMMAAGTFPLILMILSLCGWLPSNINILALFGFGFIGSRPSVVYGMLPWPQMAASVALGIVFLLLSIKVVESQEY